MFGPCAPLGTGKLAIKGGIHEDGAKLAMTCWCVGRCGRCRVDRWVGAGSSVKI